MYYVTKEMQLDLSHRLKGHQGACKNIHGHTYRILVTAKSNILNELGMVIDFKELKSAMKAIHALWDHGLVLHQHDELLASKFNLNHDLKIYAMPNNPTAENMAKFIFDYIEQDLSMPLHKVTVYETPTSFAEYTE